MTTPKTLFTLPIASTSGTITGTIPRPDTHPTVYLLAFSSPADNRLTPDFLTTLTLALDILRVQPSSSSQPSTTPTAESKTGFTRTPSTSGVVITTSSIPKFYSNGLDLSYLQTEPNFFATTIYPFWKYLLSYPFPLISLINGHAFAGGFLTAMYHDYRIMNPQRGFLCMNELEFGAPLPPPFTSIFREKLASPNVYRDIVLEAKRYTGPQALKEGIVDGIGGLEEVYGLIKERGLEKKAESGAYAVLRREMWKETWGMVEGGDAESNDTPGWIRRNRELDERGQEEAGGRVERWRAKL